MAVTYTNYAKTVSDAFRGILRDEFTATFGSPNIDIILSDHFESEIISNKGEYIRYWIEEDLLESAAANGETRNYMVGCYYYVDVYKKHVQRDWETLLSDRVEHIKTIINTNISYAPSGTYKWHNASVESISDPLTIAESDNLEVMGFENVKCVKLSIKITRGNFS